MEPASSAVSGLTWNECMAAVEHVMSLHLLALDILLEGQALSKPWA